MKYSLDYSSFVSCLWCPSFSCAILVQIPFFFSTVSFSNEDNHCQLYATLDFVKFIVSICEQTNDLSFTDKSAFWTSYFFFSKSYLKVGGAAYTRVRLIHESLRYFVEGVTAAPVLFLLAICMNFIVSTEPLTTSSSIFQ